jgi:hypothetical protein
MEQERIKALEEENQALRNRIKGDRKIINELRADCARYHEQIYGKREPTVTIITGPLRVDIDGPIWCDPINIECVLNNFILECGMNPFNTK